MSESYFCLCMKNKRFKSLSFAQWMVDRELSSAVECICDVCMNMIIIIIPYNMLKFINNDDVIKCICLHTSASLTYQIYLVYLDWKSDSYKYVFSREYKSDAAIRVKWNSVSFIQFRYIYFCQHLASHLILVGSSYDNLSHWDLGHTPFLFAFTWFQRTRRRKRKSSKIKNGEYNGPFYSGLSCLIYQIEYFAILFRFRK